VLLAWLPTYFSQTYGLDLKQSSVLSVAPWIAAAIVSNLAGGQGRVGKDKEGGREGGREGGVKALGRGGGRVRVAREEDKRDAVSRA
jgi:hypothetical protein